MSVPRAPQAVALPQQQRLHGGVEGVRRVAQRAARALWGGDPPEHAREDGGERGALGAHRRGVGLG